jgi:hypothetical protein
MSKLDGPFLGTRLTRRRTFALSAAALYSAVACQPSVRSASGTVPAPTRLVVVYIVPPKYTEQVGADFARRPVSTGPFRMTEFQPNQLATYEAVQTSWRGVHRSHACAWSASTMRLPG